MAFQHQLAHHVCTRVTHAGDAIDLDFRGTDRLPAPLGAGERTLKVRSVAALDVTSDAVEIATSESRPGGDEILHTLRLERRPGFERARVRLASTSA